MEKQYSDDTFLARWISGELSSEELDAFKKSKDYKAFKKINENAKILKAPSFNKDTSFAKLLNNLENNIEKKTVKLIPNWAYSVAAILVVALSVLFFLNNKTTHFKTGIGEQIVVTLPDNSKVNLNANSTLKFTSKNWKENKIVQLNGEAFFDVEKGATFKVNTTQGTVTVLGTEFNVISRNNYFEVKCYEGKVKVSNKSNKNLAVLTLGKAVRVNDSKSENWIFIEETPTWTQGESNFKNTPLQQVIKALENQYKVKFNVSSVRLDRRFTGSFTHENLNLALKTVFGPMEILYTKSKNNTIILKDKK